MLQRELRRRLVVASTSRIWQGSYTRRGICKAHCLLQHKALLLRNKRG